MKKSLIINSFVTLAISILFVTGCEKDNNSLAPYSGSPKLSKITIEQGVFNPKLTWIGGKISVFAVNRGTKAVLDSSLVWLVYFQGDNMDYPVKFGQLPSGAKDMTADFGGHKADSLSEDESFTFWILKGEVWNQVSSSKGKVMCADTTLSAGTIKLVNDTLNISSSSFTVKTQDLDVFVNIDDISQYGSFASVNVLQPTKSPEIVVTWEVNKDVSTDPKVSAIGVSEGVSFNENNQIWAAWSEDVINNKTEYGKSNIISSPLYIGQKITGTKAFYEFPATGLIRGRHYLVWVGNKNWDGKGRFRFTPNYAYATFRVR